jgi:hypothetical protein
MGNVSGGVAVVFLMSVQCMQHRDNSETFRISVCNTGNTESLQHFFRV